MAVARKAVPAEVGFTTYRDVRFQGKIGRLIITSEKVIFRPKASVHVANSQSQQKDGTKPTCTVASSTKTAARSWRWSAIDRIEVLDPARGAFDRALKLKPKVHGQGNKAVTLLVPGTIFDDLLVDMQNRLTNSALGIEGPVMLNRQSSHSVLPTNPRRRSTMSTAGNAPNTKKEDAATTKDTRRKSTGNTDTSIIVKHAETEKSKQQVSTTSNSNSNSNSNSSNNSNKKKATSTIISRRASLPEKTKLPVTAARRASLADNNNNKTTVSSKPQQRQPPGKEKNDDHNNNNNTTTSPKTNSTKPLRRTSLPDKSEKSKPVTTDSKHIDNRKEQIKENSHNERSIDMADNNKSEVSAVKEAKKKLSAVLPLLSPENTNRSDNNKQRPLLQSVKPPAPRRSITKETEDSDVKQKQDANKKIASEGGSDDNKDKAEQKIQGTAPKKKIAATKLKTKAEGPGPKKEKEDVLRIPEALTKKKKKKTITTKKDASVAANMGDKEVPKGSEPAKKGKTAKTTKTGTLPKNEELNQRSPETSNRAKKTEAKKTKKSAISEQQINDKSSRNVLSTPIQVPKPEVNKRFSKKQEEKFSTPPLEKKKGAGTPAGLQQISSTSEHARDIVFTPPISSKDKVKHDIVFTPTPEEKLKVDKILSKGKTKQGDNDSITSSTSRSTSSDAPVVSTDEVKQPSTPKAGNEGKKKEKRNSLANTLFNPEAPENRFRLMILKHAAICECLDGQCVYDPTCSEYKNLLLHMESCTEEDACEVPKCRATKNFVVTMQLMTDFLNSNNQNDIDGEDVDEHPDELSAKATARKDFLVGVGAVAPLAFVDTEELEESDVHSTVSDSTWWSLEKDVH